jgi:hypothetical protein
MTNEYDKDLFNQRVETVLRSYSAYTALAEGGVPMSSKESVSFQMKCPWHGKDNRPSARFYSGGCSEKSRFYCFKCQMGLNAVGIYSKFNNLSFVDALKKLESRFGIIPKQSSQEPSSEVWKDYNYTSSKWDDLVSLIEVCENKLKSLNKRCSLQSYIRFCRVIDHVSYDYKNNGSKQTVDMVFALRTLLDQMSECYNNG